MSFQIIKTSRTLVVCIALLTALLAASFVWAHGGSHGSNTKNASPSPAIKKKKTSQDDGPADDLHLDPQTLEPLYGGQVTATKWHFFEIVYTPRETRIYVYSPSHRPLWAVGLRGDVVMQVKGSPKLFRYRVKEATDEKGRVYGSAVVDVTRVRDGDMRVSFELEQLPFKEEKKAQFTQTFYLTRPPMTVTVAKLTEADRPAVQDQRVCPVMDAGLNEHGQPIKLIVGDQPMFVCCEGCIEDVRKHPQHFLQEAVAAVRANRQPPRPQVAVTWASQADDAAIRAQGSCPVMDEALGSHGKPVKIVIDGRPIFVCCEGCIDKVVKDHGFFFRKLADTTARRQTSPPPNEQPPSRPQVAVTWASQADDAAIRAQGSCPVMDGALGSHGKPVKVVIDGRPIFVCCEGCIDKVVKDHGFFFRKLADTTARRQTSPRRNEQPPSRPQVARSRQADQYTTQEASADWKRGGKVGGSGGSCCSDDKKGSSNKKETPSCH